MRETEWEAAQTALLWRDGSASMRWRSRSALPLKAERAELLLLALASLLLRGGERVALLGGMPRPRAGRAALEGIAEQLASPRPEIGGGLPVLGPLPRHARAVLIGDFLSPLDAVKARLAALAGAGVSGHVLQVLDPAETLLPYAGRIRFKGLEGEADHLVASVEGVRDAYAAALAAQQQGLAGLCAAVGWSFGVHRTDHPPETALLGLHAALARPSRFGGLRDACPPPRARGAPAAVVAAAHHSARTARARLPGNPVASRLAGAGGDGRAHAALGDAAPHSCGGAPDRGPGRADPRRGGGAAGPGRAVAASDG